MTTRIKASPHVGQAEVHSHPARFKILSAGRRWGKTRLSVNECLDVASQGGRAWWVSPSYKTSEVGWRPLRRMGGVIPGAEIRKVDRQVNLPGGGTVTVRSADNPDSLRGEGLDFVVLDECAFMQENAWNEALRPALSDQQGGALFISTPKGHNWFWRLWQRGNDEQESIFQSWTFPTSTNPYIDPGEIEEAKRTLPERIFQQEYLAMFVDDAGGVFRRVMECATATELLTSEKDKDDKVIRQYIAGVDVATLVDFTAVSVFDVQSGEQVYLDRFNRVDFSVLEDRLEAIYKRFDLQSMTIESNSIGQSVIDKMVQRGLTIIPFMTTNATKMAAIQSLQAAFEHGNIKILSDPVQVSELQAYEGERTPSGSWKYGAPSGMHDDTVMAMAIAWSGMRQGDIFVFGV